MTGDSGSSSDPRLQEVIAHFLDAAQRGLLIDRAALLEQHPDLAADLESFFADHDRVARAAAAIGDTPPANGEPAPVPAGSATLPRRLGDYELLDELGRGGMGVVYRARQVSLERMVAVKTILAEHLETPEAVQGFEREARAVAGLDHPHVVPLYEIGNDQGCLYFSMKLFPAGSLARRPSGPDRDPRDAARLVATLARAVGHAHRQGILHCDLKPGNILLDEAGQPHIADFGLARRLASEGGSALASAVVGTPLYMAPEQAAGQKDLTPAVDIHGLGVILYELLTGRPPFAGASVLMTLCRIVEDDAESPRRHNRRMDRDLETICLKCLRKAPAERYPSAEALADDLGRWLAGQPISAAAEGRLRRLRRRVGRRGRRLVAVPLLGALLAAGLAAWWLWLAPSIAADNPRLNHEDLKQAWQFVQESRFSQARKLRDRHREDRHHVLYDLFTRNQQGPGPIPPPVISVEENHKSRSYDWDDCDRDCLGHLFTIDCGGRLSLVDWSRDSMSLICWDSDGLIFSSREEKRYPPGLAYRKTVLDTRSGKVHVSRHSHDEMERGCCNQVSSGWRSSGLPSPDGRKVATRHRNGVVNVWDAKDCSAKAHDYLEGW
jgi:serine/threonine-protein kinase